MNTYKLIHAQRIALRAYEHRVEDAASRAGLTRQQFYLLACTLGDDAYPRVTVGRLAGVLALKEQSIVALINGAVSRGLVRREQGPGRKTFVVVTDEGDRRIADAVSYMSAVALPDIPR